MRTAGLPNFRKLYSKNTDDDLQKGTYTIDINMSTYLIESATLYTFFFVCYLFIGDQLQKVEGDNLDRLKCTVTNSLYIILPLLQSRLQCDIVWRNKVDCDFDSVVHGRA